MIDRDSFVNINLLKKEMFTGSLNGMRYRLKKEVTEGENSTTSLLVTIWPQPYNFASTEDTLKTNKEFGFSQEGVKEAADWLNQSYEEKKEYWNEACLWNV
ncbi:hypothetical protein [Anaerosporobacter sp.]|uniref:hypothetical protein n=1 Tax=Anaerosporobacter sp. TaxID=1872529 RepID=UPI00286EC371|nr:hypothetical protein [Anaerosporobacter sp.]